MRAIAALAFLLCAAAGSADAAPNLMAATLRVSIDGITQAGGTLRVGLYDEATYPAIPDAPLFKREIAKIAGDVAVTFERLPPGSYALRVLQDVNDDGKPEAGEPQGISNGAARADFDAATIVLEPGINRAAVHLR